MRPLDLILLISYPSRHQRSFLRDRDRLDRITGKRRVLIGVTACNGIHDIHTFNNLTKDGIAAVQKVSGGKGDKELAAIGVRTRVCHRQHTSLIKDQVTVFVHELITRSALT